MTAPRPGRRPAVIKRDQALLLLPGQPTVAPAPHAGAPCAGDLQVRIERSADEFTELRITCPCGRTTLVVCEHPPAGAP